MQCVKKIVHPVTHFDFETIDTNIKALLIIPRRDLAVGAREVRNEFYGVREAQPLPRNTKGHHRCAPKPHGLGVQGRSPLLWLRDRRRHPVATFAPCLTTYINGSAEGPPLRVRNAQRYSPSLTTPLHNLFNPPLYAV